MLQVINTPQYVYAYSSLYMYVQYKRKLCNLIKLSR